MSKHVKPGVEVGLSPEDLKVSLLLILHQNLSGLTTRCLWTRLAPLSFAEFSARLELLIDLRFVKCEHDLWHLTAGGEKTLRSFGLI